MARSVSSSEARTGSAPSWIGTTLFGNRPAFFERLGGSDTSQPRSLGYTATVAKQNAEVASGKASYPGGELHGALRRVEHAEHELPGCAGPPGRAARPGRVGQGAAGRPPPPPCASSRQAMSAPGCEHPGG